VRKDERSVVIIGPMAAGKSSVGRKVAKILDLPFDDSDRVIARTHGSISDLFARIGEEGFRALERETVASLLAEPGVLSLGGGAIVDPQTRENLRALPVVYLSVSAQAVASRLAGGARPLLAGKPDPTARWQTIYEERRALYDELADVTFDTSTRPMSKIAAAVAQWVKEQDKTNEQ
jgi:shikimate kinase